MTRLLSNPQLSIVVLIITAAVVTVAILAVTKVLITFAQERSRREIAAYIAEGSITPEHGERLMKASDPRSKLL